MSSLHVTITHPDDERIDVELNGDVIVSVNHDEHGWSGMDAVTKTVAAICDAASIDWHEEWTT